MAKGGNTTIAISEGNRERFMSNKPRNITQDDFMTKLLNLWDKLWIDPDNEKSNTVQRT